MFSSRDLYVVILAGDEDPRLAPLTDALLGKAVPKQFAFIAGDGSLLQQTVESYAAIVPPKRIVVVVSNTYEDLARTQLRPWRGICVLPRPLNQGPAVDLLFALGKVVTHALGATVIVAPAHHYIPGANLLVGSLVAAEPALASIPVIVAGAAMNEANVGDRLLVPGPRLDERILSVSKLVEHASLAQTKRLKARGALWDTSTFMARATELWKMMARKLPTEAAIVASLWSGEMETLDSVATAFRHMPGIRLNGTLWPKPKELGVIPVRGSGWSAWNSPEQVMDSLRDPNDLERLLSRIYQQQQGIDRAQLRRQFRAEARQRDVPPSCMVRELQSIAQAERT